MGTRQRIDRFPGGKHLWCTILGRKGVGVKISWMKQRAEELARAGAFLRGGWS